MDRRGFLGAGAKGIAALLLSASVAKKALAHLPSAAALIDTEPVAVEAALIPKAAQAAAAGDPYAMQVSEGLKDIARNMERAVFGYWEGGYWYPTAHDLYRHTNGVKADCFTMPNGMKAFPY